MSGPISVDTSNAIAVAKAVKAGDLPGPAKTLAEAVCRVMDKVGYVQKDKQMLGGGSYRYVSVEAVIDALRPEMIRQGLVMLPADLTPMTLEDFTNKNGTRNNRTQVKYTFKLLHAPSGESEPVVVIGEAIDVGDKSSNKAMTAARKYALIMAFNIETGLDPDDTPSHEQERAKPQHARQDAPTPAKLSLDAVPRLLQGYATAKTIDDFAGMEARRKELWDRLTAEAKATLKAASGETAARLNMTPTPAGGK